MKGTRSFFPRAFAGISSGLWLVGLWILSSLPGEDIHLPPFPGADKLAHFGYFAFGGFLLAWLLRSMLDWQGWRLTWCVLLAMAAIGALDEYHQLHTASRSGADLFDWLADSAGGFLGAIVFGWMHVKARDRNPGRQGKMAAQGD